MKKRKVPQPRTITRKTFSVASLAGTHALRFSGFSMVALGPAPIPYYIVGIGMVTLRSDGTLVGQQTSSITPLAGAQAAILVCNYTLTGSFIVNSDGTGTATINFNPASGSSDCATETGTFSLLVAGPDRFWLISTGATSPDGPPPDEVVQIEAVRIR